MKTILLVTLLLSLTHWPGKGWYPDDPIVLPVSEFDGNSEPDESGEPTWEELELRADNATKYELVTLENGHRVIKATSRNAASGLIYLKEIDPKTHPMVSWSWMIERVLEKGNLRKKRGDDYPARIYITFEYDRSRLGLGDKIKLWAIETFTSYEIPLRAISYIWANKAPVGTVAPNPFTDWVQMIAVQSGNDQAGNWISERRNIYEDYKKAFGEEPGKITGVAIMTDTDNTGDSAVGYYGDISFEMDSR